MRVLIAGATGLIGNPLVVALVERGDEVRFLTTDDQKKNSLQGAQGFYWDPKNHFCPKEALEDVDVVINWRELPCLCHGPKSAKMTFYKAD